MKVFRLLCLTLSLAWACADVPQASDDSLTVRKAALSSRTGWIELRSYTYGSGGDIRLNTNKVFLKTGYLFRRFEGFVFDPLTTPPADTVPLNAWCSNTIGDCFIVTNPSTQQRPGEVPAGYSFTRREGWIYASTHPYTPGLRALNGWRNVNSAERFETTDPEWSSAHSLDHPGWSFLGTLGYMMVPDNQPIDKFHYSEMRSGSAGPLGRRRLLAFVPIYSDEPNDRRSPSAIQDGLFGPSVPNVLGQTQSVSNGWFSWFNSGVVTFAPIDDPDTAVDERSWAVNWSEGDPRIAYVVLQLFGTGLLNATAGGGSGTGYAGAGDNWEVFGLVDHNGGLLASGDQVSFKTGNGSNALNVTGDALTATATSFSTDARFVVRFSGGQGASSTNAQRKHRLCECAMHGRYVRGFVRRRRQGRARVRRRLWRQQCLRTLRRGEGVHEELGLPSRALLRARNLCSALRKMPPTAMAIAQVEPCDGSASSRLLAAAGRSYSRAERPHTTRPSSGRVLSSSVSAEVRVRGDESSRRAA